MTSKIQSFAASTTWTVRMLILGIIMLLTSAMFLDAEEALASSGQTIYDSNSSIAVVGKTGGSAPPTQSGNFASAQQSQLATSTENSGGGYDPDNPTTREVEVGVTELGIFGENIEFDDEEQVIEWPQGFVDPEFMHLCTQDGGSEYPDGGPSETYTGDLDADAEFMNIPPCDDQGRNGVGARDFKGFDYDDPMMEGQNIKAPEGHARHPGFGDHEGPTEAELAIMMGTDTDIGDDAGEDSEERSEQTNPMRLSPAEFARNAVGDESEDIDGMTSQWEASNYLAFNRWHSVNEMPAPQVGFDNMTQLLPAISAGIASMVFSAAGLMMFLFGVALIFILSVDFMSSGIYTADYIFANITMNMLGIQGSPVMLILAILGIGLIVGLLAVAMPSRVRNSLNWGLRSFIIMFLGVAVLLVMSIQSARNHDDLPITTDNPPEIASMANTDDAAPGSLAAAPKGGIGSPGNWAMFSLGNIVSLAHYMGDGITGLITDTTSSFTNAVKGSFSSSTGTNTCDQYLAGMHAVYQNTPAAQDIRGGADLMISYDQLMSTMYFNNYQMASVGDSQSAEGAWCHFAENQASSETGDQLMIARVAGLYGDIAGTGGLGVIDDDESKVVNPSAPYNLDDAVTVEVSGNDADDEETGSFVASDGRWSGAADDTITNASALIGPTYPTTEAGQQSAIYWAVCRWGFDDEQQPGSAYINNEWQNVLVAGEEEDGQTFGKAGADVCTDSELINNKEGAGFSEDNDAGAKFDFREDDGWAIVGPMFGFGGSSMDENFALGQGEELTESNAVAYNYYMNTQGDGSTTGLILSFISVFLMFMVIKYFGPISLGALFAGVLGLAVELLLPFLLILVIIPLQATRRIAFTLGVKVLAAVMIVTALVAGLMSIVMSFTDIVTAIVGGATGWGGGDTLIMSLITGVSAWLAFWAMKHLVSGVTGFNMGTVRGGVQVGLAAGSPALQELGLQAANPLSGEFWGTPRDRMRRNEDLADNTPTIRDDETDPITDDRQDDKRDLIRTDENTGTAASSRKKHGERDGTMHDQRKGERDRRREELRQRRDRIRNEKPEVPYGDENRLRDGSIRRTSKPNRFNQASNVLGVASRIPGPQAPWIAAAAGTARGLGTASQFGRGALDKYDQTKHGIKRGVQQASQLGMEAGHYGRRGLDEVGDQLTGNLAPSARWDNRHRNRFAAASEQAPGVPSLDRDQLNRNGIPIADQNVLDQNGHRLPGLSAAEDSASYTPSFDTSRSALDSLNQDALNPGLDAGVHGLGDHVQHDAAVSWMGDQFSANDSGLYLPKGHEGAEPVDMSHGDIAQSIASFNDMGKTGSMTPMQPVGAHAEEMPIGMQGAPVPQEIQSLVDQQMMNPDFHPRQAQVPNTDVEQARMNLAARQMSLPQDQMPQAPVMGNRQMMQDWANIRDQGVASAPQGSNPYDTNNWAEGPRRKAEEKIQEISAYQAFSSQDLDQVMPAQNELLDISANELRAQRQEERKQQFREVRRQSAKLLFESLNRLSSDRGGMNADGEL